MKHKPSLRHKTKNWVKFYERLEAMEAERKAKPKIKRKSMSAKAVRRRERVKQRLEFKDFLWNYDPEFQQAEAEAIAFGIQDFTIEQEQPIQESKRAEIMQAMRDRDALIDRLVCLDQKNFDCGSMTMPKFYKQRDRPKAKWYVPQLSLREKLLSQGLIRKSA